MERAFHITLRQYGPTVYLAPAGELDLDARPAFEDAYGAVDEGTTVVACDMNLVPFMDVCGLHCLLCLAAHAQARGVTLFAYNWRRQPLRLLDVIDGVDRSDPRSTSGRRSATAALRQGLGARARAARVAGARAAGAEHAAAVGAGGCRPPR
ncbi:STAS domain-containing protein [Streptomyces sp. NPDC060048]|uniref:STAS domain-containing protein n=1 Tax=unclassified Streptomyces TaxID=2593676 RepID=UPI00369678F8